MDIKFTIVRFRLAEAAGVAALWIPLFCLINFIDGHGPRLTEFEAGGITTVVLLKCIEALKAYQAIPSEDHLMVYRLRLESIDDDPEERDFESAPEAIEYAQHWFLEGYANDTIDDGGRAEAMAYVPKLRSALQAGREFTCSMFHERISFVPVIPDPGQR